MPLLFYLPFIIWKGLREVAQGETTESDKSLNCRKVRMGRFVEAHMALICGKVITWFVGCRL
jgi:hypothetical protein